MNFTVPIQCQGKKVYQYEMNMKQTVHKDATDVTDRTEQTDLQHTLCANIPRCAQYTLAYEDASISVTVAWRHSFVENACVCQLFPFNHVEALRWHCWGNIHCRGIESSIIMSNSVLSIIKSLVFFSIKCDFEHLSLSEKKRKLHPVLDFSK